MAWTDNLTNTALRTAAQNAISDNRVTYLEVLSILNTAAAGGMTASELSDLEGIYFNTQTIFDSDYGLPPEK